MDQKIKNRLSLELNSGFAVPCSATMLLLTVHLATILYVPVARAGRVLKVWLEGQDVILIDPILIGP